MRWADLRSSDLTSANLIGVDLTQADLSEAILHLTNLGDSNLTMANLQKATLTAVDVSEASLVMVNLSFSKLTSVNLSGSNLREVNLVGAEVVLVNLIGANLEGVNFRGAALLGTNLSEALCLGTIFASCDLSGCLGLEKVQHAGPSVIDIDTLLRSIGKVDDSFFRAAGVPDELMHFAHLHIEKKGKYYTCMISYGACDKEFADRLENDLKARHVQCWKYESDAIAGRGVWDNIDRAISAYDKVIVVCSRGSLSRPGVIREIERALQKEDYIRLENARRSGASDKRNQRQKLDEDVLFPIRIDNYVLEEWQHPRRADVILKHIGDFTGWQESQRKYESELDKLLHALDPATWPL